MPPKRKPPRRRAVPVKVTTKTQTRQAPPVTPAPPPPHIGQHAVTTNQEPPFSWADMWPPVFLPESSAGFTTVDEEPSPEAPTLQTNDDLMDTAQYNDYNNPDEADYGADDTDLEDTSDGVG